MSRVVTKIRCPSEGRTMAWLEVDDAARFAFVIAGGRRGDLAQGRAWADAKGRAAWLGVLDPATGEQVHWDTSTPPTPPHRLELPSDANAGAHSALMDALMAPVRVTCPRCHHDFGVQLGVSAGGAWSAALT